jgi:hypothetical protein
MLNYASVGCPGQRQKKCKGDRQQSSAYEQRFFVAASAIDQQTNLERAKTGS